MQKIKVIGQTVHPKEFLRTDKRMGGRYQVHYLPSFWSIIKFSILGSECLQKILEGIQGGLKFKIGDAAGREIRTS